MVKFTTTLVKSTDTKFAKRIRKLFFTSLCVLIALALNNPLFANTASNTDLEILLPAPLEATDFLPFSEQSAQVGQLLFYDPLLSGNRNIACATCHHPDHGTSDSLSLGIGEGGDGLGLTRSPGTGTLAATRRIQRNAPALFNLGFAETHTLFHDGRLSIDLNDPTGFNSPVVEFLPKGLNNIIAAQAVFPLISTVEMAGNVNENEVAGAQNTRSDYGWRIITERLRNNSEYLRAFHTAFEDIQQPTDLDIRHIANALADFINAEWRTLNSPFDAFLAGDSTALTQAEKKGLHLFYGEAQCSTCHSGKLQTDQQFYSIGLPQLGPGRTRQFDFKARDMGRINESDNAEDAYRFRTPSLRNVTLTAPYGHNGAYKDLRGIIKHHLNPKQALQNWQSDNLQLPKFQQAEATDFVIQQDQQELNRLYQSIDITNQNLSEKQIDYLVAFLTSLTDQSSLPGRLGIPETVPSGLAVPR